MKSDMGQLQAACHQENSNKSMSYEINGETMSSFGNIIKKIRLPKRNHRRQLNGS